MPYDVIENALATLDEVEQKEVMDFVLYLVARKQKNQEEKKDTSFIDEACGCISDEQAEDLRSCCGLHF